MKKCPRCGRVKNKFHKNRTNKDGLNSWCSDCINDYHKKRYNGNIKEGKLNRYAKIRSKWNEFFQNHYGDPICGICGIPLKWTSDNKQDVVHWDHKHGLNGVRSPSTFCGNRPCTPENIELWLSYDFGILCRWCNRILPTEGRQNWLHKLTKYCMGTPGIHTV